MLRVHTQFDTNTVGYALESVRMMILLAKDPDELEFNLFALRTTKAVLDQVKAFRKEHGLGRRLVVEQVTKPKGRSVGHGQAVNAALQTIVPSKSQINVIMDADSYVVARHWDVALRILLVDNKVGLFGTPYEDAGEWSSGSSNHQTYKGIPNVIWMGMIPGAPWHKLDAMPYKKHSPELKGSEATLYGLRNKMKLLKDVGWQIPQFLHDHGLTHLTLRHTKPTKPDSIVLKDTGWDYHEEYQIRNVPFVVHHRGSSKIRFKSAGKGERFFSAVGTYVEKIQAEDPPDWSDLLQGAGSPCNVIVPLPPPLDPKTEETLVSDEARNELWKRTSRDRKYAIRPVEPGDHEWLVALHNDPLVLKNVTDPKPITMESHMEWWNNLNTDRQQRLIFTVNGARVGFTKFYQIDRRNRNCALGADIHKEFRGQGYAKHMWRLMIDHCFYELELHRVSLMYAAFNDIAGRVYQKIGFREEGRMRESLLREDKYHDMVCMFLLESDWVRPIKEKR
jgi:RimJ/RimL family protein N-acetyltransferase